MINEIKFGRLDKGYLKYRDEYNQAVINVLKSGRYILGERVENFEREFSLFIGSKYCVGLNSGLDALRLAFNALGIGPGDEVIVPANTFIASILGIVANGATPVFVEPNEYYNIDYTKIEEKININTKAILVVHLYGQSCRMDSIKNIANRNNLFIVEDCAQSHGARYKDQTTGTFGDIGCFSFYPTKNIGAFGDAGAIVTNNKYLANKIKMLRNYGSSVKYHNEIIGFNSRLDEIQAALLSIKLNHYVEILEERKSIVKYYCTMIKNSKIILPQEIENSEAVWHQFVVRTKNRDEFKMYLQENGIHTQIHYPIPPHLSEALAFLGYKKGDYPITESYSKTILSLPLYEGITEDEIKYIVNIINNY